MELTKLEKNYYIRKVEPVLEMQKNKSDNRFYSEREALIKKNEYKKLEVYVNGQYDEIKRIEVYA